MTVFKFKDNLRFNFLNKTTLKGETKGMNKNLKKLLPLFAAATCFIAPAFAYDDDSNDHMDHKAPHAVPPPQYAGGEDALSFFIGASYTYWVPYQQGMNIAYAEGTQADRGNTIRPKTEGRSGFKIGLGANTHHDGWNVFLNYMWFYNDPGMKSNTLIANLVDTYHVTFDEEENFYDAISSKFKNQFNRLDALVDRSFFAGHYLAFRPWLGLLGAWENQNLDFNATIHGGNDDGDVEHFRNKQYWWGIGPYAGVDATFYFTNEWGLFISSGAALLLADHEVTQVETYNTAEGVFIRTGHNNYTNFSNVEPMLENSLGLRWDSFWTEWAIRVELAWEMQTYFSHNGIQGFYSPVGLMGDYSMQGLTAHVRVNF